MIEILKENRLQHTLSLKMLKGTEEHDNLIKVITAWVESQTRQKPEGEITDISIISNWSMDIALTIKTIKEDRLKAIESKKAEE